MIIKSSTALRNDYGMISDLAHEEAEPIYITKNGEGDLVVMSIEAFEQREETLSCGPNWKQRNKPGSPVRLPTRWRSPENGWSDLSTWLNLLFLSRATGAGGDCPTPFEPGGSQLHPQNHRPHFRYAFPAGDISAVRPYPSGQGTA